MKMRQNWQGDQASAAALAAERLERTKGIIAGDIRDPIALAGTPQATGQLPGATGNMAVNYPATQRSTEGHLFSLGGKPTEVMPPFKLRKVDVEGVDTGLATIVQTGKNDYEFLKPATPKRTRAGFTTKGGNVTNAIFEDGYLVDTENLGNIGREGKTAGDINLSLGAEQESAINEAAGKGIGQGLAENYNNRIKFGQEAVNQNFQLNMIKDAVSEGARTGLGEETIMNIRSFGETLGLPTGDLSGQELIRKISNEMALRLRNPR